MELSQRQKNILAYIRSCVEERGFPPTVREICSAVGLSSPSTVHGHLRALEEAGYIRRSAGKNRAIVLPEGNGAQGIPLIGKVAAGQPILAQEEIQEYIPFTPQDDGEYFALRIQGLSMKNAGILDGDLVVVRRQPVAENGEIIVALLGEEATCKRLSRKDGHIRLLPENEEFEPIDGDGAVILGRVTAVIRTYQ